MALGNLEFFQSRIAGKADHLHTVQKRCRNSIQGICSAHKEHIGKVIGHIHIVIRKGIVLLRIQHLQKSTGRIPIIGGGQLVNFIQHHNRIGGACLFHTVHNPSGHGSDIGSSMSPDIRLIPYTPQRNPHIFSGQSLGNAFANAGFTRSRSPCKKQNGAALLLV